MKIKIPDFMKSAISALVVEIAHKVIAEVIIPFLQRTADTERNELAPGADHEKSGVTPNGADG